MVDPAGSRVVAARDDRRAGRAHRRLDPHDPARPRGASGGRLPAVRRGRTSNKRYWTLEQKAFRRLDDTGFTLAELSALYFSRTLVECLAATPFQNDVRSAFDKLAGALTPGMRQLLDRLPLVMQAKAEPGEPSPGVDSEAMPRAARARVAQLLDATLNHRRIGVRYHSFSSNREKDYVLEPYRLVFAQGGCISSRSCRNTRSCAPSRSSACCRCRMTEERFEPIELPDDAFAHSLGVNQGTPERIEVSVRAADRALREGTRVARVAADRPKSRTAR